MSGERGRRSHLRPVRVVCGLACLLLVGAGCPANAAGEGAAPRSARVDELFAFTVGAEVPGASVIVIQAGEILHQKGYGLASLELGVPNTPETVFRLASVTKQFTAMAIMQLHERGLLRIDAPIGDYLPELSYGGEVTVRHLLTHTSGLGSSEEEGLEFAPGERTSYSNAGYRLLGRIVEKVAGVPYEAYLRQNILGPLGMMSTGYEHAGEVIRNRASGYSADGRGGYRNTGWGDVSGSYAAGALYSTVRDMSAWDQALYTEKLVSAEMLGQAFSPGRLSDGREAQFGLGWMIRDYRGLREVGHGGDTDGFNSYVVRYPEQEFTVVVLSNVGMWPMGPLPSAERLAHRIVDIYLSDLMEPARELVPVEIDPEIYDAYVGRYRLRGPAEVLGTMGETLTITREGSRLLAESKVGKAELCPLSETEFFVRGLSDFKAAFTKDESGRATGLVMDLMGVREVRGEKLAD